MDKIFLLAKQFALGAAISCIAISSASAHISSERSENKFAYEELSEVVIKERLEYLESNVDLQLTPESHRKIIAYIKRYPKGTERILSRVNLYFPSFEKALRDKNLPDELKYLSIVESNLDPRAVSKLGATGLWQFMKGTGKMYNLIINNTVDERRDPEKSTLAAASYLKDLHAQFGDWTLAIAAYNCGPGNVYKAMAKGNSRDFWEIMKYLPSETRDYIPRFVAATYLMNYFHAHDLKAMPLSLEMQNTASIKVYNEVSFKDVTKSTGLSLALIRKLNPAYLKMYIPENNGRFRLTLPEIHLYAYLFQQENESTKTNNFVNFKTKSELVQGRSLVENKVAASHIEKSVANDHSDNSEIYEFKSDSNEDNGQPNESIAPILPKTTLNERKNKSKRFEYYRISPSETIHDVAKKRKDVTLSELLLLNDLNIDESPKAGTVIKIKELK